MRGLTSRKYVCEPGISMPNLLERLRFLTLLCFSFRKITQKSKFSDFFLTLKEPSVAKFSESHGMNCRKFVSKIGRNHSKLDKNTFFSVIEI